MNWDDILVNAATDTGMRRSNNQDSHAIVRAPSREAWLHRGHLFMVADGMGAHAVGELASKLACDNIPHNYAKSKVAEPSASITQAYKEVGGIIHGKATANRDFQGMGTTCSTLILLPKGALIAHVGDSRVYRVRDGTICQFSFDHSLVWELVRRNHLTPEHAGRAVPRNVITRSLGPDPNVEVDIEGPLALKTGDAFLLCSDGLSGPVTDPEMGALAGNFHPEAATRYAVHLANLRGGQDNITALVVRIGPWVDPDSAEVAVAAPESADGNGDGRGLMGRLAGLFSRKGKAEDGAAEETPYRTAPCPISAELVEDWAELTKRVQATAVEQAWSLDWQALSEYRRKLAEARDRGNLRSALRWLGETIVLLGIAGRHHRKAGGPAHVT